jgi:hypothetical protein
VSVAAAPAASTWWSTTGLQPGERVVISDLSPAIEGMPLSPQADPDALALIAPRRASPPRAPH